jgi:hypothetical protein
MGLLMKRSEMVEIIFLELFPLGIGKETCADILTLIEGAGMLPPTMRLPAFGVMDNAWEPEDE